MSDSAFISALGSVLASVWRLFTEIYLPFGDLQITPAMLLLGSFVAVFGVRMFLYFTGGDRN